MCYKRTQIYIEKEEGIADRPGGGGGEMEKQRKQQTEISRETAVSKGKGIRMLFAGGRLDSAVTLQSTCRNAKSL